MKSFLEESDAHFQQGMAHARSRDFHSAADSFAKAAAADPQNYGAYNNLGNALAAMGRHPEAIEAFPRALRIHPHYAQAYFNLGASLQVLGARDEAFACFVRTLEIDPGHDEALYYLGMEHQEAGRLNEALACYRRAADLNPNAAHVYLAMGRALRGLNQSQAAMQAFDKALNLNAGDSVVCAELLHHLASNCDWDRLASRQQLIRDLGIGGDPVPPFAMLALEDNPARHRLRSEKFAAASFSGVVPLPVAARPATRPQRLRIGYFSSDLHDHAILHCTARMFELHDRERFSVQAFSFGPAKTGAMRDRAARAFDKFHEVGHLDDQEIAELAREEKLDIAVDLNGYTEHQRLGIFARRPAPVQMTYLGFPGTLGSTFIDYLIADKVIVPDQHRDAYSERLIYLPHTYQATDNSRGIPKPASSRTAAGLPADGFVFCCFNNSYKISRVEFEIWTALLRQVDGSVLWLAATAGSMEGNLKRECAHRGIDPNRLIVSQRTSHDQYLRRLCLADLFLDTFNYNAHGTASDALWAGVPLVTKAGEGFASRVGASLVQAAGLPELVTHDERAYFELALALANDAARLASIRQRLAANRSAAPLFDTEMLTSNIEKAYDRAYGRYIDGQQPADIVV